MQQFHDRPVFLDRPIAVAPTSWTCEVCDAPIGAPFADGCVEISYWPASPASGVAAPGVEFEVRHTGCDRGAGAAPVSYLVGCARVRTPIEWAACVAATAEHAWMTKRDVVAMHAFWYEARGLSLPSGPDVPEPSPRRTD